MKYLFIVLILFFTNQIQSKIYKCNKKGEITFKEMPCDKAEIEVKYENLYGSSISSFSTQSQRNRDESWDKIVRTDLMLKSIYVGMTKDDFLKTTQDEKYSVKAPKINTTKTVNHLQEQIIIEFGGDRHYYYFEDGILTTIQD